MKKTVCDFCKQELNDPIPQPGVTAVDVTLGTGQFLVNRESGYAGRFLFAMRTREPIVMAYGSKFYVVSCQVKGENLEFNLSDQL